MLSNSSFFTPALLRTHSFVFFAVHETCRIFLVHPEKKGMKREFGENCSEETVENGRKERRNGQ